MSPELKHEDVLQASLSECPAVAILRGLIPEQSIDVAGIIFEAGIRIIEVPLNSPEPLKSISLLAEHFGDRALIGAGTVLDVESVEAVANAGGRVIVSPNTNRVVIEKSKALGLVSLPGCFTVSEAFEALSAGADALKLFPGEAITPSIIKALRAVLPRETRLMLVGGVSAQTMPDFLRAGIDGFGIGSWLFRPGRSIADIGERAVQIVAACRQAQSD